MSFATMTEAMTMILMTVDILS
jgi:hypothetical protein